MIALNHILRKCTGGYKLHKSQEKINNLMYMDDIKTKMRRKTSVEILSDKQEKSHMSKLGHGSEKEN